MTPEELFAGLEGGTLEPAAFHHEQHVAAAWAALRHPDGGDRIRRGLRALAARAGVPERYDDHLTLAFLHLIEDRRQVLPGATWAEFRAAFPELFDLGRAKAALAAPAPKRAGDWGLEAGD